MSDEYRDEMGNEFAKATAITPILFANINPAALPRRCKDLNGCRGWCHAIGFGTWENRMIALAVFEHERGTLTTVPVEWITLDPVKEAV